MRVQASLRVVGWERVGDRQFSATVSAVESLRETGALFDVLLPPGADLPEPEDVREVVFHIEVLER